MTTSAYRITLLHRLVGLIGAAYLYLVGWTSIVRHVDHPASLGYRRLKKPMILGFWHRYQAFLAWEHRGEPIHTVVSLSRDGEFIAQVMKLLRVGAVRGSSSRGGQTAFREICSLLEGGAQAGFTPDGPRGPEQRVHGGIIAAARLSGVPIVPLTMDARRKIEFRSWDRFLMPLPFTTITVAHGAPLWIGKDEEEGTAAQRVREALNANVAAAEEDLRSAPIWIVSFVGWALGAVYGVAVTVLSPLLILVLMAKHGIDRTFRHIDERVNPAGLRPSSGPRLWLHAASVGEWQALRPILRELQKTDDLSYVITVSATDARAVVARDEPSLPVRMLPIDYGWVVRRWLREIQPEAVVFVESEIWPNLLAGLRRARVPAFIVNGRLSERGASRWAPFKPLTARLLAWVSHVFARSDVDGRRFCALGAPVTRITVTGNTKMDNLEVLSAEERGRRRAAMVSGDPSDVILLAGSTWPGEEAEILKLAAASRARRLRIMIAPRRPARFEEVGRMMAAANLSWSAWSQVKGKGRWDTDVLLVDTLGELKNLYGVCDIAFVGGSLPADGGGQNPLEPAAAGVPVLFGPSMSNFHVEAEELKKSGAARQSRHADELRADVEELTRDDGQRRSMGEAAARHVRSRQGAAERTARSLRAALLLEKSHV